MKKINDTTWSAEVPAGISNITFHRLSSNKRQKWNSWCAIRNFNYNNCNTYHILGPGYGYWGKEAETEKTEEGFQEGDVIYLDFYEFQNWENFNASFYICFANDTKQKNCNIKGTQIRKTTSKII